MPDLIEGASVMADPEDALYVYDCSPGSVRRLTWSGEITAEFPLDGEEFIFPPLLK